MQQGGVLEVADLHELLADTSRYPAHYHTILLGVMRKCELCFDLPDSGGQRMLIPGSLPINEPDLEWDIYDALNFQYQYDDVLPTTIMTRFIVRMHHYLTRRPTYWRNGVLLDIDGSRSLVRADLLLRQIDISIAGEASTRRQALAIIRDTFAAIHQHMPRLQVTERVPLPDNPDIFVDYSHLLRLAEKDISTFYPVGADEEYSVRELLDGVRKRQGYDVYLSYNSQDITVVRRPARVLQQRGLTVWFAEWEIAPGDNLSGAMADGMRSSKTLLVTIGEQGIGPWQEYEVDTGLSAAMEQGKTLIPVLLPGSSGSLSGLPSALLRYRIASLADGFEKAAVDELIWGITGKRPGRDEGVTWIDWLEGSGRPNLYEHLLESESAPSAIWVRAIRLHNIRAFEDCEIHFTLNMETSKLSTTLLLGDNSAGKSTVLQCIALGALGPDLANQAENRADSYLRYAAGRGFIEVLFELQLGESIPDDPETFCVGLEIRAGENSFRAMQESDLTLANRNTAERLNWVRRQTNDPFGFLCAYGSWRSLSNDPDALVPEDPKEVIGRVKSLFDPNFILMDPDVLNKMLAGDLSNFRGSDQSQLDERLRWQMSKHVLKLLPGSGGLNTRAATTLTMYGVPLELRDLSDGYGSLLSIVGHLFRHALAISGWQSDPAQVRGVVLIDEIDLHLHPEWQRRVLPDFADVFPNLQIIVTSHSAMVAGSVSTNAVRVLRRQEEHISVLSEFDSIKGWQADQILTSLLLDLSTTRDVETERMLAAYAAKLNTYGPEHDEVKELGQQVSQLMQMPGEGIVDVKTHELLDELLRAKFQNLDEETRQLVLAQAGLVVADGTDES